MDYKDRSEREDVWDKFSIENNMDKDVCQRWFQSQSTLFEKVTHMKSNQGKTTADREAEMDQRQFSLPEGPHRAPSYSKKWIQGSQGVCFPSHCSSGLSIQTETVHMELFQDTSRPKSTDDPADLSNLDTHTPTPRLHGFSVTSNHAESD